MGKNHRHKKDLKADKAKVKLKQTKTKFLPKGLNVTNTTFKIKPIVLAEQLKEKDDVPLSKRKLNVKDLLSRIKHYNENVRFSACEELSSMFKYHTEELINQNLSQIVLSVSTLMQDREQKVRKAAVKIVKTILEITPPEKLEPFFNYFSTNMRCAMTNIDHNIQEDSLLFLDCFLIHDCGLVSRYSDKLLPDFFTLISKLRSESSLNRTVTLNLGSKMTSVTWRIKALSKLHSVLEIILYKNLSSLNSFSKKDDDYKKSEASNVISLYKESFSKALDSVHWDNMGNSKNIYETSFPLDEHIVTLVPLLYETWIEVIPEKKIGMNFEENIVLTEEASAILSCVMSTLYLLWKYAEQIGGSDTFAKNVFLSNEGRKFLNHLLSNFPYCQGENISKAKKKPNKSNGLSLDLNTDPKCVKENIMICYIVYSVLDVNFMHRNIKIELEAILSCINRYLHTKKYIDENNVQYLIEFLNMSLLKKYHLWKRAGLNPKSLVENTIVFYNITSIGERYKMEFFKILAELASTPYLGRPDEMNISLMPKIMKNLSTGCPRYNTWLNSLPDLLCKSKISDVTVEALLDLSRKNNKVFQEALLKKLPDILENLDSLKIIITKPSLINNEEIVKRNILTSFIFVAHLSKKQIQELERHVTKNLSKYYNYLMEELQNHCKL
ncbi:hypothetical protein JTB14_018251 [Gonioctena quinquepunctata]|nr:hypothetical protein JTB14_018251 [Gonioctena quinquepunctata]